MASRGRSARPIDGRDDLVALEAEVTSHPNIVALRQHTKWTTPTDPPELLIPYRLDLEDARLSMFTTITTFGSPRDITLDEIATYVDHGFSEQLVDVGGVRLNYVRAGEPTAPALLLIPGQTESWWGYGDAISLLADHFDVFAVDPRGQGRSTRTPGRYTLDNMGNDLVRFIDLVIGRPSPHRVTTSSCCGASLCPQFCSPTTCA